MNTPTLGAHRMVARVPIANWLFTYRREWLRADILAGVSVAAVAVPIAIAYAQLAGLPPVHGLYASLLPLVAYAVFGSSRQLIIAPDAATCALVAAVVAPLAGLDSSRYVSLSAALAMITGVLCILAGFARLGFLTNFLARPILTGYLNGIAVSIIAGQLAPLFGFSLKPAGFFRLMWQFFSRIGEAHGPTLLVGATTLAVLLLLARVTPKVPGPLVAVALGILCAGYFKFADHGVKLLGAIPAGLPHFAFPVLGASDWETLAIGAVGLALISYNSAMVTARGFATKNRYDLDPNQEFIALGVANLSAGALQGFAVSGADSRTAVNDSVGGKSQVTGLVAAVMLVITLLFLTGPLGSLPIAVLSAVLIKAALGLFDVRELAHLRRVSPQEFRLCLVTLLGVITVGVLPGVVIAIGLALGQLLFRASVPHDAVLGRNPRTNAYRDVTGDSEAQPIAGVIIYRFDASLVFFNADHFKSRVHAVIRSAPGGVHHLLIDAETMPSLDTTGAASIDQVRAELEADGIAIAIAAAKHQVRTMLERTGVAARIGPELLFPTVESAVEALSRARTGIA